MFCAFFFSLGKFYIDKMANGKNVQREIKKTKSHFSKTSSQTCTLYKKSLKKDKIQFFQNFYKKSFKNKQ